MDIVWNKNLSLYARPDKPQDRFAHSLACGNRERRGSWGHGRQPGHSESGGWRGIQMSVPVSKALPNP